MLQAYAVSLLNGARKELWFRRLFLKKYDPLLGSKTSYLLQATAFAFTHIRVIYTPRPPSLSGDRASARSCIWLSESEDRQSPRISLVTCWS